MDPRKVAKLLGGRRGNEAESWGLEKVEEIVENIIARKAGLPSGLSLGLQTAAGEIQEKELREGGISGGGKRKKETG